ncbi:MAG: glycosyltransferase family 39 protein [Acidobacteriota bacterium]|nr:glycosyltransferase family 39 protein [Acidobacteriota bacterium]
MNATFSEPTSERGAPCPDSRTWDSTSSGARRAFPLTAILFLLLTATISLLWSHHKLLSQDEFFALQTDSARTVSQLIHIQRTTPISLDPLVPHLLAHFAMRVFGAGAFALRLPAFLGYLTMQVCLFFIVRRFYLDPTTGDRAGIFALAFPALTATLFYSAEGRPYGLLLGLYALTLLAWQSAIHRPATNLENLSFRSAKNCHPERSEGPACRTAPNPGATQPAQNLPKGPAFGTWVWLPLLSFSIALTLNSHYFGVLLLIPLCAAEISRTIDRRRIDIPVVSAIVAGMAAIVFALPFEKSAAEFRLHYYNGGTVDLRAITQSYRALFVDYTHASLHTQHIAAIAIVISTLILISAFLYRNRDRTLQLPFPESVFIFVLAALPFFGFLLARFVTHSIEVRYVLGAIIGVTVLLAVVLAPALRRDATYRIALALLFAAIPVSGLLRIHAEIRTTKEIRTSLVLSPELKAAILASPTQLLYIQDMGHFEVASYYEPDPFIRSHIALLYSRDNEILYDGHDTVSLTAMHMRAFTGFPIVAYDDLKRQPGPHILVLFHSGWDWTDQALAVSHPQITPLAPVFGGNAVSVRFAP